jgi:predicted acetyltransferase
MNSAPQVELHPVEFAEKPLLRRLMELYQYDYSEYTGEDIGDNGEFGYNYLDHYWVEEGRYPFIIKAGGKLAGFVLVRVLARREGQTVYSMAEFFVMRKYRRQGVGQAVACQIFDRFPGWWQVEQSAANVPAQAFWRRVIGDYTGGRYEEIVPGGQLGPVQRFNSAGLVR